MEHLGWLVQPVRMETAVRGAVVEDAELIADAHVQGWRVGYRGLVPDEFLDDPQFAEARRVGWRPILSGQMPGALGPPDQVFVPVVGDRVVGFVHVGLERASSADGTNRGELHGFYVHPNYWGTGIADQLLDRCHEALDAFCGQAMLWVLRDNPRARRFYERNGWSCGVGVDLVEAEWAGPVMDGVPQLGRPLPEVEYRRPSRPAPGK